MLTFLIFSFLVTINKGITGKRPENDFAQQIEAVLDQLSINFSMTNTVNKAREQLQDEKFETWTQAEKSAALIINLFTSSDEIHDAPGTTFYRSVQKELRSGNQEGFWKRCADLLNDALQIIGLENFKHLYRGEREWQVRFPEEGGTYYVPSFWSTTLDPSITIYFDGHKDFFYDIQGAEGVRIDHISVIKDEKEVLIPSARSYRVVRIIRDSNKILEELEKIMNRNSSTDLTKFKPKVLIILAGHSYEHGVNVSKGSTRKYGDSTTDSFENSKGCESFKEIKKIFFSILMIHILKQIIP